MTDRITHAELAKMKEWAEKNHKLGSILTVRTDTTSPTNSTETAPPAEQDTSSPSRTGSDSASEVDSKEAITTRVLEFVNSGKSFVATAAELGMTKGQVAGIWHRNKDDAADSRSPRSKKKRAAICCSRSFYIQRRARR